MKSAKRFAVGTSVRVKMPGVDGIVTQLDDERSALSEYWHTIKTDSGERREPGCNLELIEPPISNALTGVMKIAESITIHGPDSRGAMNAYGNSSNTMPQPQKPFTIASVAPTLSALKALPKQEQAMLLLRRLAYLFPQVERSGGFNKHNILLPGDQYAVALGFSDAERMTVLEHLLGVPWTLLVNEGYLVDPRDSKFFLVSEEGFAATENAAKIAPLPQPSAAATLRSPDGIPTVFFSYSWESEEHREWVIQLAARLRTDGVNVVLDYWDLQLGGDRTQFMENGVSDSDFVVIVCTPEYAAKAKKRAGGVGYEAMVITGQLANQLSQKKFIPVLRSGNWDDSAVPVWLQTKIGIDLRGDRDNEDNYQQLLRTLHGETINAPPIGPKPVFSERSYLASHGLVDNAVSAAMDLADSNSRPDAPVTPDMKQSPVAYAIYETKGANADRVEAYVRPIDRTGQRLRMETSKGEITEGTLPEIADHYLLFDRRLRQKGYSRMTTFDGSGGRDFNLP